MYDRGMEEVKSEESEESVYEKGMAMMIMRIDELSVLYYYMMGRRMMEEHGIPYSFIKK